MHLVKDRKVMVCDNQKIYLVITDDLFVANRTLRPIELVYLLCNKFQSLLSQEIWKTYIKRKNIHKRLFKNNEASWLRRP